MDTRDINFASQEDKAKKFQSAAQAEEFVRNIYSHRKQSGENTEILAATLQSNIHTVFNSAHKYIFDLLQNADDSGAKTVVIDLHQGKRSLLFSHNGNEFLERDVTKICENARPSGDKVQNKQKTGYNGVGFKANFCISDKITIISNHVSFCFDSEWEDFDPSENYPWPIIPIWVEKSNVFNQLKMELPLDEVHFFLERINEEKVEKELNVVFNSPELLLLLRKIESVSLPHLGITISCEKSGSNDDIILFKKNEAGEVLFQQVYKMYSFEVYVPSQQHDFLSRLPSSVCPEKLKSAEFVSIVFVVQFELNQYGIS